MPLPPIPQKKVALLIGLALWIARGACNWGPREKHMKIAVVAPSCTLKPEAAERVMALAAARGDCELAIHSQCFLSDGHFAGSDSERLGALKEVMADDRVDAVWFARGGYGSNRIAEAALA